MCQGGFGCLPLCCVVQDSDTVAKTIDIELARPIPFLRLEETNPCLYHVQRARPCSADLARTKHLIPMALAVLLRRVLYSGHGCVEETYA